MERSVKKPPSIFRYLTSPARLLPNFIIIGAQKCGTSTMYWNLCSHPSIYPARYKEVHYFDRHFANGESWYRTHFPLAFRRQLVKRVFDRAFVTGEASPYYISDPRVPKRVASLLPHVKLIALLRNPVHRAYSHYQHQVRKGRENLSFEAAIEAEAGRLAGELERMLEDEYFLSPNYRYFSYLSRGIYVDQLRIWYGLFEEKQLLILKSEDFFEMPHKVLDRVFQFLELPAWQPGRIAGLNVGEYDPIDSATFRRLVEYFEPHNQRLYEFLGIDLHW